MGIPSEVIIAAEALGGLQWWVIDSGSSTDLVSGRFLPEDSTMEAADEPAALNTANGPAIADQQAKLKMDMFDEGISPVILPHAPPIFS